MLRTSGARQRAYAALGFSSLVVFWGGAALGQAGEPDARSRAQELLRDAEQLRSASNAGEACTKYGQSASLEPQLDALLPWAHCLEQDGKLASAFAAFTDAADVARRSGDPRAAVAEQAAEALRPRVSFLSVEVPSARRLPAMSVDCDGYRVGDSSWGAPLPVDPGTHVVVVRAFGHRDWHKIVEVQGEAQHVYVEVPQLQERETAPRPAAPVVASTSPVRPAPPAAAPPAPAPPASKPRRLPPADKGLATQHKVALAAGAVSVVGLGLGLYFWSQRDATLDERDGICPSGKDCEPGTNARLTHLTTLAREQQRAGVALFALAGASAALGAGLWFWPRSQQGDRHTFVAPVIAPGSAGLVLGGRL